MAMALRILSITFLVLFTQNTKAAIYDVTKYGNNGNVARGFMSAWKEACAQVQSSVIIIPKGTYAMGPVELEGRGCKGPIEVKLIGNLTAPKNLGDMQGAVSWIAFNNVDRLTITGGGTFDGQGQLAWNRNVNLCHQRMNCKQQAANLRFYSVTNSIIRDVTTKDSKNFHVQVISCKNVVFDNFSISAPEDSLNTDGIHVARSEDVKIVNSVIKTGDDCVSVGDGTQRLHVERVTCGPGHGFSIGSLGRYPNESNVNEIYFKNCTLTGTTAGMRIKTLPSSPPGASCTVNDVHFEDIILNNVSTPLQIDQEYCAHGLCNKQQASLVQISNVFFKNIKGSTRTPRAIELTCSSTKPCNNIQLGDIDMKCITKHGKELTPYTQLANVKPVLTGKQNPVVDANGYNKAQTKSEKKRNKPKPVNNPYTQQAQSPPPKSNNMKMKSTTSTTTVTITKQNTPPTQMTYGKTTTQKQNAPSVGKVSMPGQKRQ